MPTPAPFIQIDPRHIYRFFVDGRFYAGEHGWEGYAERQEGSIQGMTAAYCHMLDNFPLKGGLTLRYITELHEKVTSHFNQHERHTRYPGQMREFGVSFLLRPRTCSVDGLRLLIGKRGIQNALKDAAHHGYRDVEDVYRRIAEGGDVRYAAPTAPLSEPVQAAMDARKPEGLYREGRAVIRKNLERKVHAIVADYNRTTPSLDPGQQLRFLIDMTRRLERLHPFVDCNIRVFVTVLLNHLLMLHGFLPTIYEDPSIFDARTTDELLVEVRLGQRLVQKLIDDPDAKVFSHSLSDEKDEHHIRLLKLMEDLVARLHPRITLEYLSPCKP